MIQTTVKVDGMMCGMCEAHVNDAVRKAFPVRKVSSSHGRGETVILSEDALDEQKLRAAIDATGYTVTAVTAAPYTKKGFRLFG
ncbi:MAG: heavy-metal-associated domain-containing protein [Oscillospiraceae bacterium]|nr:heavy-metal-associated domain-containing protein [Oscillospiraceae bacterium]